MRGTARRSRQITGFSPGEFLLVAALIGVIGALAIREQGESIARTQQTELFSLAGNARVDWAEMVAIDGLRGATPGLSRPSNGRFFDGPETDESGSVNFFYKDGDLAGEVVSMRPAFPATGDAHAIVWVCGNAPAPAGFTPQGENFTSVPPARLSAACRARP